MRVTATGQMRPFNAAAGVCSVVFARVAHVVGQTAPFNDVSTSSTTSSTPEGDPSSFSLFIRAPIDRCVRGRSV
eukprot:m.194307 g.194307  ORF g.194307 m.194307 type:complete len:74 (-) comp15205_c0_seq1:45-266(-)